MISGTIIGFVSVGALLAAAILLAILDRRERGRGNVTQAKFLSRMALVLFLAAFVGGVIVTLVSGIKPRDEDRSAAGMMSMGQGAPMGSLSNVDQDELERLKQKVQKDPKDLKSRERLGHLYLQMQDYEHVFEMAHEAIQLNPDSVESRIHMGMVFFTMQDVTQALGQIDLALAKDPKNLEALAFKGLIQLNGQENPQEAKKTWQKYLKRAKPGDAGWGMVNSLMGTLP